MNIVDLPNDCMHAIVVLLPATAIACLSRCCSRMRDLCKEDKELLWLKMTARDFGHFCPERDTDSTEDEEELPDIARSWHTSWLSWYRALHCLKRIRFEVLVEREGASSMQCVAGHSMTACGRDIVVVGGRRDRNPFSSEVNILRMAEADGAPLAWKRVAASGEFPSVLARTAIGDHLAVGRHGHTAVVLSHGSDGRKLVVFGGVGPYFNESNQCDVLDLDGLRWSQPEVTGVAPCPRTNHVAVELPAWAGGPGAGTAGRVLVHGGHTCRPGGVDVAIVELPDHLQVLGDSYVLHTRVPACDGIKPDAEETEVMAWAPLGAEGECPALTTHAGAVVGGYLVLLGGRGAEDPNPRAGDHAARARRLSVHLLDLRANRWLSPSEVFCSGDAPSHRRSHSVVAVGAKLVVYGGYEPGALGDNLALSDMSILDCRALLDGELVDNEGGAPPDGCPRGAAWLRWTTPEVTGRAPRAGRYEAGLVSGAGAGALVLAGGAPFNLSSPAEALALVPW